MLSGIERLERICAGYGSPFFDVVRHDHLDYEPGTVHYQFPVPVFGDGAVEPTLASYCCAVADIACTSAVLTVLDSSVAAVTQGLWVHFESVPADTQRLAVTATAERVGGARLLVEAKISGDTGKTIARVMANCVGVTFATSKWSDSFTEAAPQSRSPVMKSLPLELGQPANGSVEGRFAVSEEFSNAVNMLHGGAATLVAEAASRQLLSDASNWTLADMDCRFVRPIPVSPGAVCYRARVRHSGKSSATVSWEIFDQELEVAVFGSTAWARDLTRS